MFDLTPAPPVAAKRPKTDTVHGDIRTDDYFWLREKGTSDVTSYLDAENTYTDAVMAPARDLETSLYDEMLGRVQETDLSVPYQYGDYLYYTRTEEGKQYSIYCRKPINSLPPELGEGTQRVPGMGANPTNGEQVTLDLNVLAEGKPFLSLGNYAVSDDGNLLAFTTDETGFREYTLRVKDLRTGDLLPDTIDKVDHAEWARDNQTLFYTTEDDTKRAYRLCRHALGATGDDPVVYEEQDGLFRVFVNRSRDRSYLFFGSESFTEAESYFLRADDPTSAATLIRKREPNHEYTAEHREGLLYIRTNKDATNFRLVTAPIAQPDAWTELIAHRPDIMLENHDCFARHLVLTERVGGLPRLRVLRVVRFPNDTMEDDEDGHDITFPEPTYATTGETNRVFDTDTFRFRYGSLVTPTSVFDYDMNTRERKLLKETPVLGGYDRGQYVSDYLHATAADGTPIPISVVRRRDTLLDGSAPALLYGYGSYGISMPALFSSNRLSLLDRGFVFAIAHIRGGGELGKPWHDAGKMKQKWNTFDDFIACADYLVGQKMTSPKRLAIQGGSAGGLLMGAVVNKRPDLFHAVLSIVPFVDVINTMLDDTLPLTIGEYVEWGNPQIAADYGYMKSYCPYTNLRAGDYPITLVRTSLNDSQVMYWEPAKFVAKLRTLKTNPTAPLLFHINMAAGHGGSSGRYDALRETAFDYAFLLTALGK